MSLLQMQFREHKHNLDYKIFLLKATVSKDKGSWLWEVFLELNSTCKRRSDSMGPEARRAEKTV